MGMTPERWQRVDRLFQSALDLPPGRRASYLREACDGDAALRQEVESLIESHQQAGSFIEEPAAVTATDGLTPAARTLAPGRQLGAYRIEALLGTGGMGRVYRALDTRLGREVALKVLPDAFAADAVRLARFEREARAVAALNHPNIVTLHSFEESGGFHFLTMELVDGRTLERSIAPEGLALETLLSHALALSDALAAAHQRGIVHRDLKPGNVMLTHDGRLKLLDFGLATIAAGRQAFAPLDQAGNLTGEGLLAGTYRYMSPEQVQGRPLDCRSDVFALGVVLYELAAGHAPFGGQSPGQIGAAILHEQPAPLRVLRPDLPPALADSLMRCLEKDPRRRFADAGEVHRGLQALAGHRPTSRTAGRLLAALSLVAAVIALPSWRMGSATTVLPQANRGHLLRYDAAQGTFLPFLEGISVQGVDTSHDGRWVAYTTFPESELWRARVDGGGRRKLTELPLHAALPRWSPDGTRIAFVGKAPGRPWQIHIVPAEGGPLEVLPAEDVGDPGWTADGAGIVFGPASGRNPVIHLWDLDLRQQTLVPGSQGLFSPRPSPDGRYLAALDTSNRLMILELATGRWSTLAEGEVVSRKELPPSVGIGYPTWTRDGAWLHFRRDGSGGTTLRSSFHRIDPVTRREELVVAVDGLGLQCGEWGNWSALSPAAEPLVLSKSRQLSPIDQGSAR
jgi:serine/threonine protein kinase